MRNNIRCMLIFYLIDFVLFVISFIVFILKLKAVNAREEQIIQERLYSNRNRIFAVLWVMSLLFIFVFVFNINEKIAMQDMYVIFLFLMILSNHMLYSKYTVIFEKTIINGKHSVNAEDIVKLKKDWATVFTTYNLILENDEEIGVKTSRKARKALKHFCEINNIEYIN